MKTYSLNIFGTIIIFDVSFKNTTPRADAVPDDSFKIVIDIISVSGKHIKDMKNRILKNAFEWEPV